MDGALTPARAGTAAGAMAIAPLPCASLTSIMSAISVPLGWRITGCIHLRDAPLAIGSGGTGPSVPPGASGSKIEKEG